MLAVTFAGSSAAPACCGSCPGSGSLVSKSTPWNSIFATRNPFQAARLVEATPTEAASFAACAWATAACGWDTVAFAGLAVGASDPPLAVPDGRACPPAYACTARLMPTIRSAADSTLTGWPPVDRPIPASRGAPNEISPLPPPNPEPGPANSCGPPASAPNQRPTRTPHFTAQCQ